MLINIYSEFLRGDTVVATAGEKGRRSSLILKVPLYSRTLQGGKSGKPVPTVAERVPMI